MRLILLSTFFLLSMMANIKAQPNWVDKVYSTQTIKDLHYGEALDYGGTIRSLTLDLAYPMNDQPPICGRPLMMIIHGGAWLGGDKAQDYPPQLMKDFAERGYVTASINYRLGMFQTEKEINCNISGINGLQWNCLNMTDSLEWVRAWYRAVQDAKGALRFLIDQHDDFQIDRRNVFVVGESAGAFTAMGVVYLDEEDEKPEACDSIAAVPPPHQLYEQSCIKNPGFALDIDSMDLHRSDLGSIHGELNPDADPFQIKACGDLYGGLFQDLFSSHSPGDIPALYLYHQPADLIVPINYNRILSGFSACSSSIGGCQSIYGRPYTFGSSSVVDLIKDLQTNGTSVPDYYYDKTTNNASCLEQILNPALGGHSLDNYVLRTGNMAAFFAEKMDQTNLCLISNTEENKAEPNQLFIYPNPTSGVLNLPSNMIGGLITLTNSQGVLLLDQRLDPSCQIDIHSFPAGLYHLHMIHNKRVLTTLVIKR